MRSILQVALLSVVLALSWLPASAQTTLAEIDAYIEEVTLDLDNTEKRIAEERLSDTGLEETRVALEQTRQRLIAITNEKEAQLAPLVAEYDALGPAPEGEATEAEAIAEQRDLLDSQIAEIEVLRRRAFQAEARVNAVMTELSELRSQRFTQELFSRQASPADPEKIVGAVDSFGVRAAIIGREISARTDDLPTLTLLTDRLALPILMLLLALFLTVRVRGWLIARLLRTVGPDMSSQARLGVAAALLAVRAILPTIGLVLVIQSLGKSGVLGPNGMLLLDSIAEAFGIAIGAYALSASYFAPNAHELRISTLPEEKAARAHRWVSALALVAVLDRLLIVSGSDIRLTLDALSVINAILLVLGGMFLWRLMKAIRMREPETAPSDDDDDTPPQTGWNPLDYLGRLIRFTGVAAAIVAPVLALAGYYGASRFLFYPVVYSGAVIGICALIYHGIRFHARGPKLADADGEQSSVPETSLLQVLTGIILAFIAAPILAGIWGAGEADLLAILNAITNGFEVGTVTIAPKDFIVFAVVFVLGYLITRMLQGVLRRSVLPAVRMDEGAKSALLSGIGYVGVGIAALVAISTTGIDLSNLAIVAGALSVGIGFGLQNVVNNFVSGIILLIERPIKTGDWVEINGAHGTVKRVKVRSTEIQKFDRSTMFVPNADLISGTVINWTHGNSLGRLIVSVGVAYGSDARQVEKILLQIAQANPMLARRPAPYILFTGFGADSIDFEIRGVLRDVNNIMTAASDIRFSIYERFAEEGIEIPFAQRDVMIKNIGDLKSGPAGD
ncbi:MAG: mechanosensitive ion channel domain-containing protein [Pseudomonadota bacterium]